jgi:hypothetical protein
LNSLSPRPGVTHDPATSLRSPQNAPQKRCPERTHPRQAHA